MSHDNMTDAQKRLLDNIINPVKMGPRVKGRFKLRAMKGDIIMRETPWCPNIVVNGYFDRLFNGTTSYVKGFLAGAGTSTPAVTDTALQSYLGGGNSMQESWHVINSTVSPRSFTLGYRIRANEGAVVGNVSEVGLYTTSDTTTSIPPASNRPLINRARVTDELGNPTSITVLSDEFLEVVWEFVFYAIDGATGTLTINIDGTPTSFDYEIRPIAMNYSTYWNLYTGTDTRYRTIGPSPWPVTYLYSSSSRVTTDASFIDPSGSTMPPGHVDGNNFTERTPAAYVAGSLNRTFTIRLPLNNGNINVRSIILCSGVASSSNGGTTASMTHQVLLDGPFEKKPTHLFDLPINVSMGNA